MSHYRTIRTQLTQGDALVRSLVAIGVVPETCQDLHRNALTVKNGWDSKWVAIKLTSQQLLAQGLIPSQLFGNGSLGYFWNEEAGAYEVVMDQASDGHKLARFNQMVAQRYGVTVATEQAQAAGWSVYEELQPDGSVVLTCTQY